MFAVYRYATPNDYLKADLITMHELRDAITKKLKQIDSKFDRIALFQMNLLLENCYLTSKIKKTDKQNKKSRNC